MFMLYWSLKNRHIPFYDAIHIKWTILRKSLEELNCRIAEKPVCASALSQARQALGSEAMKKLLDIGTEKHLHRHDSVIRVKGYRLYAIDGSSLNLHSNGKLEAAFGRPVSTGEAKSAPQASFTALYLVNTGWIAGFRLGQHDASELEHTKELSRKLVSGDLLLGDRLSFDTDWFKGLSLRGVCFMFRASSNRYKSFTEESVRKIIVAREKGDVDCQVRLKIKGRKTETIGVRYIEKKRKGQETLRFITNLPVEEFPLGEVVVLYRLRWEIETGFRFFKGQNHLEVIISRTETTVKQEVYSRVLAQNTVRFTQASACMAENQKRTAANDASPGKVLIRKVVEDKWQAKSTVWPSFPLRPVDLQFNASVAIISAYVIDTAISPPEEPKARWKIMLSDMVKAEISVRDGRSFKRKGKKYNKGKRNKGNRKDQYKSRKRRLRESQSEETE
jgi:hypothetical protein